MARSAPKQDPLLWMVQTARDALRDSASANVDLSTLSLEQLATSAGLGAHAPSPPQLALLRAIDGHPIDGILSAERTKFHFGTEAFEPRERPKYIYLRTGVRAGKSLLSSLGLLRSALTCDMSGVRPGEYVRAPIISARLETSRAGFHHLVGTMQASTVLRRLVVGEPGATAMTIRRPDGREVVISLMAASAAGTNTRSTWMAGVMLDEADFFDGEGKQANLEDQVRAIIPRLLPGAQLFLPSSPWSREGHWFEECERWFGKPGRTLMFHSDSLSMNPTLAEVIEEERARDPDNTAREYDAIPLSINNERFFPPDALERCIRRDGKATLDPLKGVKHTAGVDLGLTKNSSALAISRIENGKVRVAYADERRPVEGESPRFAETCRSFAESCLDYGVREAYGDHYLRSMATDEFAKVRRDRASVAYCGWTPNPVNTLAAFVVVKRLMVDGKLDIPNDPRLIKQFDDTRCQPTPGGSMHIQLPKHGRAHGDVLMSIVLSAMQLESEAYTPQTTATPRINTFNFDTQPIGWG